ncbi:hypothetical protein FOA52_000087 [Chlamydomonas sp. UWO 241]|nr:hypothetical protein FOA52_000087 [Chlamydomonas sp. UWO 241]
MAPSDGGRDGGSANSSFRSFGASSSKSMLTRLTKFELKKNFYEKLDDFKFLVVLHREESFVTYRARCTYSGAVVILKGYMRDSLTIQAKERVWNEVQVMKNVSCPFMLKCFDCFEDGGSWWLVLENAAAGDLLSVITEYGQIEEEGWLVTQVLLPLMQTLTQLHSEGIIHRGIRPDNLFFNSEKVCKVAGFYFANNVTRVGYPKDLVGTLDYMAPEMFIFNNSEAASDPRVQVAYPEPINSYDQKADIWQVGVLMCDLINGVSPFESETAEETVSAILFGEAELPLWLSKGGVDFIQSCLTKRPGQRPTARQLLSHPWIRAHLDWEPPDDFDDPIQLVDYKYYTHKMDAGPGDEESDFEFDEPPARVWYNPATWVTRPHGVADAEQDLSGMFGKHRAQEEEGGGGWAGWVRRSLGMQPAGGGGAEGEAKTHAHAGGMGGGTGDDHHALKNKVGPSGATDDDDAFAPFARPSGGDDGGGARGSGRGTLGRGSPTVAHKALGAPASPRSMGSPSSALIPSAVPPPRQGSILRGSGGESNHHPAVESPQQASAHRPVPHLDCVGVASASASVSAVTVDGMEAGAAPGGGGGGRFGAGTPGASASSLGATGGIGSFGRAASPATPNKQRFQRMPDEPRPPSAPAVPALALAALPLQQQQQQQPTPPAAAPPSQPTQPTPPAAATPQPPQPTPPAAASPPALQPTPPAAAPPSQPPMRPLPDPMDLLVSDIMAMPSGPGLWASSHAPHASSPAAAGGSTAAAAAVSEGATAALPAPPPPPPAREDSERLRPDPQFTPRALRGQATSSGGAGSLAPMPARSMLGPIGPTPIELRFGTPSASGTPEHETAAGRVAARAVSGGDFVGATAAGPRPVPPEGGSPARRAPEGGRSVAQLEEL